MQWMPDPIILCFFCVKGLGTGDAVSKMSCTIILKGILGNRSQKSAIIIDITKSMSAHYHPFKCNGIQMVGILLRDHNSLSSRYHDFSIPAFQAFQQWLLLYPSLCVANFVYFLLAVNIIFPNKLFSFLECPRGHIYFVGNVSYNASMMYPV